MLPAVIVFLVVTSVIVGVYFAVSALPGLMKERQLERRLRDVSAPIAQQIRGDSIVLKAASNAFLDRVAAGTRGGAWLGHLIDQSGVRTTSGQVILISLAIAVLLGLLGAVLARPNWVAPVAAAAGLVLPTAFLMRKRSVRMRRFEELFPEALDLLSRAVKAGHAFQTAMNMAAEELPDPVGPEFRKTFDEQNFGLPLRDALNAMSERIPIIDVKFFVTAVLIQRETGGNLSEILDNLSHVVRERFKVLRQVRVHTAHGRFTGWVLLALPAVLAVVMSFINPEHMNLLFRESMGRTMLLVAAVMQTIGFFWIKRVIKIEV
ncbi:MAG TPA: type II secretion system F family protein [Vicinamibacterales bacterium]|nr:type II secretion system F family protein [Vicinamibacterales bacterium]